MVAGRGLSRFNALASFCIILALCDVMQAEEISWRTDVKAAAQEAKEQGKPMLLQITATWCGFCHKMFDQTYTDEAVVRQVNGDFIPVRVDADEQERLIEVIGVKGLPTTVIISADLDVVGKFSGFKSATELTKRLEPYRPKKTVKVVAKTVQAELSPSAFEGICLVSLLDDKKLKEGKAEHADLYRGQRVVFASAEAKERFLKNPRRYWPALDGNCPVSQRESTKKRDGSVKAAVIYRGMIWLCGSAELRKQFAEKPAFYAESEIRFAGDKDKTTRTR